MKTDVTCTLTSEGASQCAEFKPTTPTNPIPEWGISAFEEVTLLDFEDSEPWEE